MRHRLTLFAALACCLLASSPLRLPDTTAAPKAYAHRAVYRFDGGRWFDGQTFTPKTMYSVDGVLRETHAGKVDQTYDLAGKFIIAPFAEGHTHHFMEGMDYRAQLREYLARGVFYAKNPNSIERLTTPVRAHVNTPSSVDAVFANGGLTSSGGHPVQVYDFLAERGHIPGWTKEMMSGQAYFVVDSERDLAAVWPKLKAGRPDFVKAYLEHSEEHGRRKGDAKFYGQRGLDPALLPVVVARAHADGLRVAVHVNTAADFRAAIASGADEVAHLPLERLTDEDARGAARRGAVVQTTTISHRPTAHVKDLDAVHRHNLALLRRAGVTLALGTDDNNRTVFDEVDNLRRLAVFDELTLLKIWTEDTPRSIFPGRKIGLLKDGYEASFLALDGNPLELFAHVKKIGLRIKQGHVIKADGTH